MNKAYIRKPIFDQRCKMSSEDVTSKSDVIFRKLRSTNFLKFNNFLLYSDFKNEVKTEKIINYLLKKEKAVYLPVCDKNEHTFKPARIYEEDFKKNLNKYGIAEPVLDENDDVKIDCAIIPGIVFDKKCNRIGFGGGYYDRFLNDEIYKIAVCYDFQISEEEIVQGRFDVPMDVVISERRMIVR